MTPSDEVLFLTPVMPARTGNGLAMRAGVLLEGLARSHAVHVLVAPVFGDPAPPDALVCAHADGCSILDLAEPADVRGEITSLLATPAGRERAQLLHPRPALCGRATAAAARHVAAVASGTCLVHVMRLYLAPLLDAILDGGGADRPRLSLDLDDLDAVVQRRLGAPGEAGRYERLEAYYVPRVDLVLTAGAGDAEHLRRRHPTARVEHVPNAVRRPRLESPRPSAAAASAPAVAALGPPTAASGPPAPEPPGPRPYDLLFVGNLSYVPNIEAVRWLCQEVIPLLPGVAVAVVGSRPDAEVLAIAAATGVTVAADVDDVSPWYARSAVAVAPLAAGGGTRIKVLEALAHRRPVVTTAVGAEGLGLGADDGVIVADGPEAFAAACRRLLDDPGLAERLARAGERAVLRDATVERVAATVDALVRSILAA